MTLFGLGFRPKYYHRVLSEPTNVEFFEIISENFMGVGGRPQRILSQLCDRYPVVMHGVGLGVAGTEPLQLEYLESLKKLLSQVKPRFVSDHLCWTTYAHKNSHDLLPVSFTEKNLELVSNRLAQIQDYLGCRFLLENPSAYVAFAENDMDEATFLAELVRRSGCGILLDVNNLFINVANLGYDPVEYLKTIPCDAVAYFHLAGHSVCSDVRIDTHDDSVCREVWTLYRLAAHCFSNALTLLERDDNYPPFDELEAELTIAREHRSVALSTSIESLTKQVRAELSTPLKLQTRLCQKTWPETAGEMFEMIEQSTSVLGDDTRLDVLDANRPVSRVRGINVYNNAYFFRLRDCLASDLALIELLLGKVTFTNLLASYISACPSSHYNVKWVGARLPMWLRETKTPWSKVWSNSALADLIALELKRLEMYDAPNGGEPTQATELSRIDASAWESALIRFRPCVAILSTSYDLWQSWLDLGEGAIPEGSPPHRACEYLVYRNGEEVYHERLERGEALVFRAFAEGKSVLEACAFYSAGFAIDSDVIQAVISHLIDWCDKKLVQRIETV